MLSSRVPAKFQEIMELTLLAARLVLAAVFLLAGAAKFVDPVGSGKAFINFGLPRRLALILSLLLAPAEMAVAIALIPVGLAWYGACGALALLFIFIIGIGVNLARGRKWVRLFGIIWRRPATMNANYSSSQHARSAFCFFAPSGDKNSRCPRT